MIFFALPLPFGNICLSHISMNISRLQNSVILLLKFVVLLELLTALLQFPLILLVTSSPSIFTTSCIILLAT